MADRWIVSEDRRTVVNVNTGTAVEAVKDRTSSGRWAIRVQTSGFLADLAVREGAGADRQILDAFAMLVEWLKGTGDGDGAAFEVGAAIGDEAELLKLVEEPEA